MYEPPYSVGPDHAPGPLPPFPHAAPPPEPQGALRASSQMPMRAQATVAALLGVILAVAGYTVEHEHPRSAIRHWRAVLARGDLGTLLRDERLGARGWIRGLIQEKGEADYRRVLGIYDRAAELGQAEFRRFREVVEQQGQRAYDNLPYGQQQAVSRQSHNAWVCTSGIARVAEAAAVGNCAALWADPTPPDLLQRLGTPELDADEQALLANRAASDPAVVADATLAGLAARRTSLGERALGRIRERVEREGEREFRRLEWSDRHAIDSQSRDRFIRDRGFATLNEADRARLGNVDALFVEGSSLPETLGLQQLAPAARAEIAGRPREDFVARHARYVEDVGARLTRALLVRTFGNAQLAIDKLYIHGGGGRDLLRRQGARAELAWTQLGPEMQSPATITLRWSSRHVDWRIADVDWRARETEGGDE